MSKNEQFKKCNINRIHSVMAGIDYELDLANIVFIDAKIRDND